MAALKCIAAARIGFLLAALHSVAERVNPRKARPPAPQCPRVLAKGSAPICLCWEKSARLPRPGQNQNTESCDLFHPRGSPRWLGIGSEAAERDGGGVRCGLRVNGDEPRRVVRLPTADSLCDRMERGEEEAPTAAVLHLRAAISADIKAVRFRRAAAENFRPEIFEARATLREQRESAVGRRIGKPLMSPFARRPHRTPPPPQPLSPVPVCYSKMRNVPILIPA